MEVIRKAYPWDLEPGEVTNSRLATRADYASGWVQGSRAAFLNGRAAARYRALASIIPGRERFSWKLSF